MSARDPAAVDWHQLKRADALVGRALHLADGDPLTALRVCARHCADIIEKHLDGQAWREALCALLDDAVGEEKAAELLLAADDRAAERKRARAAVS